MLMEKRKRGRPRVYEDWKAHRRQYMRDRRARIARERNVSRGTKEGSGSVEGGV